VVHILSWYIYLIILTSFISRHEAANHVVGVGGAVFHAYANLADAQAAFIEALYAGVVRVVATAGQAPGFVVPPPADN
jgi:hypothetical protein